MKYNCFGLLRRKKYWHESINSDYKISDDSHSWHNQNTIYSQKNCWRATFAKPSASKSQFQKATRYLGPKNRWKRNCWVWGDQTPHCEVHPIRLESAFILIKIIKDSIFPNWNVICNFLKRTLLSSTDLAADEPKSRRKSNQPMSVSLDELKSVKFPLFLLLENFSLV